MKTLQDLSQDDLVLLRQAFIRLMAEGVLDDRYHFGDLLDMVLARGYDTRTDYIFAEELDGGPITEEDLL